jgi:hypothetical protein
VSSRQRRRWRLRPLHLLLGAIARHGRAASYS